MTGAATVGPEPPPEEQRVRRPLRPPRPRPWTRIAALLAIAVIAAIPFMPGSFVPDTLNMCSQAQSHQYTDWHSPIFAAAWGFFDPPVELLFVGQVVLFVSAVFVILRRWLRPWVAVGVTLVITLFPASIGWLGNVGKDEWFAVSFLWGLAFLSLGAERPAGWRRSALLSGALAGFWLAVAARQVGVVPVSGVLLVGWPGWRPREAQTARVRDRLVRVASIAAFAVAMMASQAAWTAVVIRPTRTFPEQPTYQYDLAAVSVRSGENLFPPGTLMPHVTLKSLQDHLTYKVGGGNDLLFGEGHPVRFPLTDPATVDRLAAAWKTAIR